MACTLVINTVYSRLHTDDERLKTILWKSLRYRENGYFHNPLYRAKKWDGFRDFFTKKAGQFLTGLLPEVVHALRLMNIEFKVMDRREPMSFLRSSINEDFLWQRDHERPLVLRDYQVDLANQALRFKRGIIHAPTSAGKAQPLDALVFTPNGPKLMGEIELGESVCTPNGKSARVIGIYPQGSIDVYRVKFSNGDEVECCGDHLWKVDAVYDDYKDRVLSTNDLRSRTSTSNGSCRFAVNHTQPVHMNKREVPIDPYLLGLLLGDGYFGPHSLCLSTSDSEILEYVQNSVDEQYHWVHDIPTTYDYRLVKKNRSGKRNNKYLDAIRSLGLSNKRSHEKFVPELYLFNSVEIRREILRGLLDSDGYVDTTGRVEFTSTSIQLAQNVKLLVESLGGSTTIRKKVNPNPKYKASYTLAIRHPQADSLFRLSRKKDRVNVNSNRSTSRRLIESIELIGKKACQCILIDDEDHLYLTNHFIPTHNTNVMLSVLRCIPPKTHCFVLVDSKELVYQNYNELVKFGFQDVGMYFSDAKQPNYITVALINSVPQLQELYPKVRAIIVDEVHDMMSSRCIELYKQLTRCDIRIGFSATPFKFGGKDKCQMFMVKGHIGAVLKTKSVEGGTLTTAALQERDILSRSNCTFYVIDTPQRQYDIYQDAVTYGIAQNDVLNNAVARLVKTKLKGRTLLVVDRIEHGERLLKLIPGSFWLHGSQKKAVRHETVENLKHFKGDFVAIAIDKIVNKGVNVFIHNLVNIAGGKADHKVIQRMGRGLRTANDKEDLNYYDFLFRINPYLEKHSEERVRILEAEGHEIVVKDKFDF